jgi:hypothetical protein
MRRSKIIIFSWDFYPSSLVSRRRTTYWARHLKSHLPDNVTVTVATGNPQASKIKGIDEVRLIKKSQFPIINKIWNLMQLIGIMKEEVLPAVIILSAGPFYFLAASPFIPKRHKLIFDLRDPFLGDTKNEVSPLKKTFRKIFQSWFLNQPDAIITINESLKSNFGIPDKIPHIIVPNGFESSTQVNSQPNKKILVLGKVYGDLSKLIDRILALDPEIEFHQYVDQKSSANFNLLPLKERVFIHQSIPSEEVPKLCEQYGIGLVSSYPEDFVLPVKIFDYLNSRHKLIIINDKNVKGTEIKNLLKNYPGVLYSYDDMVHDEEFKLFLDSPQPDTSVYFPPEFFRKNSTENLANFIQKYFL